MKILFFVFSFVSSFLLSFHFDVHAVFNWFLPVVLFLFGSLLNLILLFLFMFLVVLVLHVVPSIPLVPPSVSCFVHVFIFSLLAIARIVLCLSFAAVLSSFPFSDQFSFYVSLSFHLVFSVFLHVSSHVSFFFSFFKDVLFFFICLFIATIVPIAPIAPIAPVAVIVTIASIAPISPIVHRETWRPAKSEIWQTHQIHIYMGAGQYENKHGVGILLNKKWRKRVIDT